MKLDGNKTYIAGIGAILVAVGSYLTGDMNIPEALNIAITGVVGIFLRHGISKKY